MAKVTDRVRVVSAPDILNIIEALDIPEFITTPSKYRFDAVEAFCLTLARFRSAGDLSDLCRIYHRSQSAISEIVNFVTLYIDNKWKHLLDFDHTHLLHPENLAQYAAAIHQAGAPINSVWSFLDCTIRRMCRPSHYQRQAYNGHKKYHALKFQALMLPNGIIGHLDGPYEGRRNDNHLLRESGLLEKCAQYAIKPGTCDSTPVEKRYFQMYGDAAYGISPYLVSPFYGEKSREEQEWNNTMGAVRVEVEHGFGLVAKLWPFLNAGWKMQLYSSPVGSYYRTGVLLTNAFSCLHPNQTSLAFDCQPPTLHEYFHEPE
ncbi:hypothetical protein K435DRAFT_818468 [Dendrothele bispora CBS 962.96]|uniref:DDE Tnp4 domain-containing protein n=1 Tax=Dendrothele bispora (strain CBS 962.96) TaxID=1314807 RepID=A0A4S8MC01_DENBC|nr:hypothetical protein K435DRAFT_818468 [Dendrothele bispora CBS 962.96]